jgi:hypothetical protein
MDSLCGAVSILSRQVKSSQRPTRLHKTSQHFPYQAYPHNFLPSRVFSGGEPPAILFHFLGGLDELQA